jgi:hypothetical protein
MMSVVVVLSALAVMRDDREVACVLLEYVGRALLDAGVRTPVDIVLFTHYLRQVRTTTTHRERAAELTLSDALTLGLGEWVGSRQ